MRIFKQIKSNTVSSVISNNAIFILLAYIIGLAAVNFRIGFSENPDALRLLQNAKVFKELGRPVASRSWGMPLFETCAYLIINNFGTIGVKVFSLSLVLASSYFFFKTVQKLTSSRNKALLVCLVCFSNPLIIIASNSILETSLNIFSLVLILWYLINRKFLIGGDLKAYIMYGLIFALATLVRPDNMLYYPVVYLFLFLRNQLRIWKVLVSSVIFIAAGILPYYSLGYPIFKVLPATPYNHFLFGIKGLLNIFGLPLTTILFGTVCVYCFHFRVSLSRKIFRNDIFLFIFLGCAFTIVRLFLFPDQLEYGIFLWLFFGLFLALLSQEARLIVPRKQKIFLIVLVIATFLPNLFQIYFFEAINFQYRLSLGITSGVFAQERQRRKFYSELWENGRNTLVQSMSTNKRKPENLRTSITFENCDSCIVFTSYRELEFNKTIGGVGTDTTRQRYVFTPTFNVSRGWRNFIKDSDIPRLTTKNLILSY